MRGHLRRSTHFFGLTWVIVRWATRYGTLMKGFWPSFVDTHTVLPVRRRCMTPSASISALTTAIRRRRFIRLKQGPWSECQISDWLIFVAISPDVIDCFVLASSCISLRLELAW